MAPKIHVVPSRFVIEEAVRAAGGELADLTEADALVWLGDADTFPQLPDTVRWVQLPFAGIEPYLTAGIVDEARTWTNAAGFYADQVAEHALTLLLAGLRQLPASLAARSWDIPGIDPKVRYLRGSTVAIVGAGGIGESLIAMLTAFGVQSIAVTRSGRDVPGAARSLPFTEVDAAIEAADHVVIAAPSTPETRRMFDSQRLALLGSQGWLINVARGDLVDTDALLTAVREGVIAGASLDVTEPEPLPDGHPLWDEPNVIVTPHVANPRSGLVHDLAPWVTENVRRFAAGEELVSVVPAGRGY